MGHNAAFLETAFYGNVKRRFKLQTLALSEASS
jgi:hypothetical protein